MFMQSWLFGSNSQPISMCKILMAIQPIIQYKSIISYNSVRSYKHNIATIGYLLDFRFSV